MGPTGLFGGGGGAGRRSPAKQMDLVAADQVAIQGQTQQQELLEFMELAVEVAELVKVLHFQVVMVRQVLSSLDIPLN